MKAVQIVFKVLLILALIAMCLVIIFVTPKPVVPDLNSGIQVIPEKDSTLVNANNSLLISPDSIPETDSEDAINLAYKMYLIANENMKKTDKWTTLVDCSTTMYIGSLFEIPVVGRRYYLKNGTEYYYTEYQVPGGGAGGLAGMAAPENSDFVMYASEAAEQDGWLPKLYFARHWEDRMLNDAWQNCDALLCLALQPINRMPGEYEDKFRQLRLLLMYQFAHPGKKLNFMGYEFGQFIEWDFRKSLDWFLLSYPAHRDMQVFTRQLNRFYSRTPALYEQDDGWQGFEWVSVDDDVHSILAFIRRDSKGNELLCAFNFTPVKHDPYRIQLPRPYLLSQAMSNVDFREMHGIQSQEDPQGGEYVDIMLSPYEAVYYYLKAQPRPKPKPNLKRGRRAVTKTGGSEKP